MLRRSLFFTPRLLTALGIAAATVLLLQGAVQAQASPYRIMPLGDSITDGYNVPGGYRIDLEDDLTADGVAFDFVGSLQNGPAALADRNHEGHSGFRIDQISSQVTAWLTAAQPDVVLLMIGTNDVIQDYQLATAPNRLGALLDQILAARPQAHLLVSSIPPLPGTTDAQQVRAYNAAIPGLVDARANQGRSIRYVEVHNALTTADLADGVHPNAAGHSKIADVWHTALIPLLGSNQAPSAALTAPTSGASFPAGADVALAATASDPDGSVARVEFLANGTEIGEDASAPYSFTWVDPPAGGHTLTARAVDNVGATASSAPVSITVQSSPGGSGLYRAINLAGPALTIDGVPWEAGTAVNLSTVGSVYENQSIPVEPATSEARATMLRSVVWSSSLARVSLLSVPSGSYDVFVSIWEDNRSATVDVRVEGQLVRQGYRTGAAGHWERLGPFRVSLTDGSLDVTAGPGANLSGIEVFSADGGGPPPNQPPSAALTAPASGATFAAGADVALAATASDPDGSVARVEFLANGIEIGEDASAPYSITWVDPPAGAHTLTARAVDNVGASASSAPASITVQSAPGGSGLYRAINLAGPALTIDGVPWEAGTAANLSTTGSRYENQSLPVEPATSAARATMLRSVIWSSSLARVSLLSVPAGSYDIFVSIWEDNRSATVDIRVEGQLVRQGYQTGAAGHWERLGPFRVSLTDGSLDVTAGRGANLSGIEVFTVE